MTKSIAGPARDDFRLETAYAGVRAHLALQAAGLSHMEFSTLAARRFFRFCVALQRVVPANAATPSVSADALIAAARTLVSALEQRPFSLLRPGVMGPC